MARAAPGELTVTDALAEVVRSASDGARPHVLLLDEFQEAVRWSKGSLARFRAALQHAPGVVVLALGSQAHTLRALFSEPGHVLYGFAQPEYLDAVAKDAWISYLKVRSQRSGVAFNEVTAARLVERVGGHPYELMRTANHVILYGLLRGSHTAALEDIDRAFEETLAETSDLWAERWRLAATKAGVKAILRAVATGRGPYDGRRDENHSVQRGLKWLSDQGWLERPTRGRWGFVEPMFAEYVRRLRP